MSTSTPKISMGSDDHRASPGLSFGKYLPVAVALVVALGSTVTLAAFDKPLDRHALVPSVIECAEAGAETSSSTDAQSHLVQQGDATDAHAMLLRYELLPLGATAGRRASLL